jgi:hypothetical protein
MYKLHGTAIGVYQNVAQEQKVGYYSTLFFSGSLSLLESDPSECKFGDIENGEVMFVPMPKTEDSANHYVSAGTNGFLLCQGAENPEGAAAYINCAMAAVDATNEFDKETLKNDYGWTDEMIEMRSELYSLAEQNPIFEFGNNVSDDLTLWMSYVSTAALMSYGEGDVGTEWSTTYDTYAEGVNRLVSDANASAK